MLEAVCSPRLGARWPTGLNSPTRLRITFDTSGCPETTRQTDGRATPARSASCWMPTRGGRAGAGVAAAVRPASWSYVRWATPCRPSVAQPVAVDVVFVEDPAETRALGENELALLERGVIGNQVPPKRVAIGMEAFDDHSVGLGRDEVSGNLWLLVVAHPHVIGIGDGGGAKPVVGPPDHEESKLQTSIAPCSMRSRQPAGEYSLCPAHTGMPPRIRTSRRLRRSFSHRTGSSNQVMSRSWIRSQSSSASGTV